MACIKLEEYQTAKTALENGASLAPGDSRFTKLIKECDQRIAGYLIAHLCIPFVFSVYLSMSCMMCWSDFYRLLDVQPLIR